MRINSIGASYSGNYPQKKNRRIVKQQTPTFQAFLIKSNLHATILQ